MPVFDVVGVGLNATDTLLLVPHFPAYAGKAPFTREILSPGGQVASAMVACARLGLRAKYIGAMGDDERGRIQMESLRGSGIDLDHVQLRPNCANQSAYIIIDQSTGERTVFWTARRLPAHRLRNRSLRNRSPARACCTSMGTIRAPWRTRPASRASERHPGHGGCRYHLRGLRPRAAECRLSDRQLRISRPLDWRAATRSGRSKLCRTSTACASPP